MKKIAVFDTTICNYNLGNGIIMESIYKHLRDIFPDDFFFKLPYMDLTEHAINYFNWSDWSFFGGTNSLSAQMETYKQWGLTEYNYRFFKNVILMGMGWWQYQAEVSEYTQKILIHVLSSKFYHSVRDTYTESKLKSIGIHNVLNTGCPTLWDLTEEHCKQIPTQKGENVLLTFTDYYQDFNKDVELYHILKQNYHEIYIWIQGMGDYDYAKKIDSNIQIIPPKLDALNRFLSSDLEFDYVGTRLHAGIRAMQYKRRSIIIGVDNRAVEMGKDFNLNVVHREQQHMLEEKIKSRFETKITLPLENIKNWKEQFKH